MTDDLTKDAFLGGRLQIWQPRAGYRAGVDPVLLAAAVPAKPDQSILELGCGVGVASLCLGARVKGLALTGIELQTAYAELAIRNSSENALPFDVLCADLRAMPDEIRQRQFDHVMMNPPYFERKKGNASQNAGRDIAMGGDTPLTDWLDIGIRRVAPRGYLTLIQRITRLPEVLGAVTGRLGSIAICPIAGRAGKPPTLFLLQARQDGRAAFRLLPSLILHEGDVHTGDQDSYRVEITDVLRNGAALSIWD